MIDLTELSAELERNNSVDDSARVAITRLLDEVAANANAPAAIAEIVARWRASTDNLAAAVATVPEPPAATERKAK